MVSVGASEAGTTDNALTENKFQAIFRFGINI